MVKLDYVFTCLCNKTHFCHLHNQFLIILVLIHLLDDWLFSPRHLVEMMNPVPFIIFIKKYVIDFRQRGRWRKRGRVRERETSLWNTDWLPPSCTLTGEQTHNQDMRPDWKSNWWPGIKLMSFWCTGWHSTSWVHWPKLYHLPLYLHSINMSVHHLSNPWILLDVEFFRG